MWRLYVLILDSDGYKMSAKYSRGNLNAMRNEIKTRVEYEGEYDTQLAAWVSDGQSEERYYTTEGGCLPVSFYPHGHEPRDEIMHDVEDTVHERIIVVFWDEDIEQYTIMFILTDQPIDVSNYVEV